EMKIDAAYKEINKDGLTTLGFSSSKNDTDTTTWGSEGYQEHETMSRSYSLTLEGFLLEDPDTGEPDEVQAAMEELGNKMAGESLGEFRLTSPGGKTCTFKASVNITGGVGGGNDDKTPWGAELTLSGKPEWTPAA